MKLFVDVGNTALKWRQRDGERILQGGRPHGRDWPAALEAPLAPGDNLEAVWIASVAGPEADQRIVVNMADSQAGGFRTYETLRNAAQNFLGVAPRLAGIVRRDKLVREAIRRQTPLTIRHPNAPAAMDVDKIAGELTL